jgi:hypothetical protein
MLKVGLPGSEETDLNVGIDPCQINAVDESSLESNMSIKDCSRAHEEANGDMDEDEVMTDYGSGSSISNSNAGSSISNSLGIDLRGAVEDESDSRQDIIAPVLDQMRKALVDRVMEEFWVIFNQNWETGVNECAGGSSDTPGRLSRNTDFPSRNLSTPNSTKETKRRG